MSNYKTLHKFGVDEYIVEKSTFIGYAKPIKTEEDISTSYFLTKAKIINLS